VLAYTFLATYQAYYLLEKINSAEAEVPYRIFLGTLLQAAAIIVASIVGARLSDRTGRRNIFVITASLVYGLALFVIARASTFNGYLVGMTICRLGLGLYLAVDLALVADVLPEESPARISACSTSRLRCPSPSRRRSRRPFWRPFWRPAARATACCMQSPECPPSSEPSPSCR
jgi:MFS family permease